MGRTSIPCNDETRDVLKQLKDESGKDWDSFLLDLAEESKTESGNSNEFNLQDIESTVRKAIRDELPVDQMRH